MAVGSGPAGPVLEFLMSCNVNSGAPLLCNAASDLCCECT